MNNAEPNNEWSGNEVVKASELDAKGNAGPAADSGDERKHDIAANDDTKMMIMVVRREYHATIKLGRKEASKRKRSDKEDQSKDRKEEGKPAKHQTKDEKRIPESSRPQRRSWRAGQRRMSSISPKTRSHNK